MKRPVTTQGRGAAVRRVAAILVLSTALATSARARGDQSIAAEGGTGAGAAIVTLVYAPLKLAYAVGGLTLAGLTWLWTWGNGDVASVVAKAATDGDYVVTPAHLRRESDLDFDGDEEHLN